MKKILIILIMLLMIGCVKEQDSQAFQDIDTTISNTTSTLSKTLNDFKNRYYDTNPIKVGIYNNGKLVTNYNVKFQDQKDIAVFYILFTNEETLTTNDLKTNWYKYYNQYENINDYKIGFYIELEANSEKKTSLFLNPNNQYDLDPYLYPFIYDGIHSTGKYSHLTMDKINSDTIYSTIKLFLYTKSNEITSPIYLTVFTYKDENDFLNGMYRGNSKHTVIINNQ